MTGVATVLTFDIDELPVPYVRAWTYTTVPFARISYQALYAAVVDVDTDFCVGAVCGAWMGRTPFVAVFTMFDSPPPEVQATIESLTEFHVPWTVPAALQHAMVERHVRSVFSQKGELRVSGYRLESNHGMYQLMDRHGREWKGESL